MARKEVKKTNKYEKLANKKTQQQQPKHKQAVAAAVQVTEEVTEEEMSSEEEETMEQVAAVSEKMSEFTDDNAKWLKLKTKSSLMSSDSENDELMDGASTDDEEEMDGDDSEEEMEVEKESRLLDEKKSRGRCGCRRRNAIAFKE